MARSITCFWLLVMIIPSWGNAIDIIPYNQKHWTKFNQLSSMKIATPTLVSKTNKAIGIISEEIRPKISGESVENICLELKGETKKNYCKVLNTEMTTFVFFKEFEKGIFCQSISFNKKYSIGIAKFESGLNQ